MGGLTCKEWPETGKNKVSMCDNVKIHKGQVNHLLSMRCQDLFTAKAYNMEMGIL